MGIVVVKAEPVSAKSRMQEFYCQRNASVSNGERKTVTPGKRSCKESNLILLDAFVAINNRHFFVCEWFSSIACHRRN